MAIRPIGLGTWHSGPRRGVAVLDRLGVVAVIDEVIGPHRCDAGASVGTYLALGRLVDPCSERALGNGGGTTAADQLPRSVSGVLDHRRFGTRCTGSAPTNWLQLSTGSPWAWSRLSIWTSPLLALDMTNFPTYIDSTNAKAPIAQPSKASSSELTCAWSGWAW